MAKKEETALSTRQQMELDRPDFIARSREGLEDLSMDDLKLPWLVIAQKSSYQLEEDHALFIDGLKFLDLFNDVTNEIYEQPVRASVICRYPPRGIEFIPRDQGGGVKDMEVPLDDPRMKFGPNGEQPVATLFYDYILYLHDSQEIVALSCKGTSIKSAKSFNMLMHLRNAPVFAGVYDVTAEKQSNDKGVFGVYRVKNTPSPNNWVTDETLYKWLEGQNEQFKSRRLAAPTDDHVPEEEINGGVNDEDNPPF